MDVHKIKINLLKHKYWSAYNELKSIVELVSNSIIDILWVDLPKSLVNNNCNALKKEDFHLVVIVLSTDGKRKQVVLENLWLLKTNEMVRKFLEVKYWEEKIKKLIDCYINFVKKKNKKSEFWGYVPSLNWLEIRNYRHPASNPFRTKYI